MCVVVAPSSGPPRLPKPSPNTDMKDGNEAKSDCEPVVAGMLESWLGSNVFARTCLWIFATVGLPISTAQRS